MDHILVIAAAPIKGKANMAAATLNDQFNFNKYFTIV
jgi:hypothetical protein